MWPFPAFFLSYDARGTISQDFTSTLSLSDRDRLVDTDCGIVINQLPLHRDVHCQLRPRRLHDQSLNEQQQHRPGRLHHQSCIEQQHHPRLHDQTGNEHHASRPLDEA